jgi:hypothetical protein
MYSGVFHTLWFAMSNHNLNHFLTWLTVWLFLVTPRRVLAKADTTAVLAGA